MNFRLINSILSRVIMLQGILLLPSCLVGILYHEWHDVLVYLIVSICCTLFGLLLYQVKPKSSTFYAREGFVAVSLSWIIMSVIGAMPFYFSSDIPAVSYTHLSPLRSVFLNIFSYPQIYLPMMHAGCHGVCGSPKSRSSRKPPISAYTEFVIFIIFAPYDRHSRSRQASPTAL